MKNIGNQIKDICNTCDYNGEIDFLHMGTVFSKKSKTLTYAENLHYFLESISNKHISTIITKRDFYENSISKIKDKAFIFVDNPKCCFWKVHNFLAQTEFFNLEINVKRGKNVIIHPTAYVEKNTIIGNNVVIGAGSIILNGTIIGDGSIIEQNCTIGTEGLQVMQCQSKNVYITHVGGVKIGKRVRILSNTNISKAVDDSFTVVEDDTIISLQCSIGHNSVIGKNCQIAGNVLVGGSVKIGNNVWIGPSSTIKDAIIIEDGAQIKIGSVVITNVKKDEEVSGNFAYKHTKRIRNFMQEQK